MSSIGNLVANLTANTAGFSSGLKSATGQMSSFSTGLVSQLGRIGLAFNGLSAIGNTVGGVLRSIGGGATGMVQLAADAEQTQVAFSTMLGSGEAATKMLSDMRKLASSTPLETKDIADAGKTLLQFGVSGNNVLPILKMLGDVSGGNSERFKSLSLAFGQMSAAGRLTGQDLLQMINAGFNPLQEISKRTGESMATLKKRMEDGGIGANEVMQAFQTATSEGGQFFGMMQKQSQTVGGLWSTLKDNVALAMTDIGKAIIEGFDLKGMMGEADALLQSFRSEWLPGIIESINTVGTGFKTVFDFMRTTGLEWISSAISTATLFATNWDITFQLVAQYARLGLINAFTYAETFFTNAGELLTWFGDNWQSVLFTVGDYAMTVFINLGQNIRDLWRSVLDFIATGKFEFNATPLTDGFHSAISEMPELAEAALMETTPEIEALLAQLGELQADAAGAVVARTIDESAAAADAAMSKLTDSSGTKKSEKTSVGAAVAGSRDAFSAISKAANDARSPALKAAQDQLKEQKKTNDLLENLPEQIGNELTFDVASIV